MYMFLKIIQFPCRRHNSHQRPNTHTIVPTSTHHHVSAYQSIRLTYLLVVDKAHATAGVTGRGKCRNLVPSELDAVSVGQVLIGSGSALGGNDTLHVRQQLLQVASAGNVVSMHMRVHCPHHSGQHNNIYIYIGTGKYM